MARTRPTLAQAQAQYPHRFTMEHMAPYWNHVRPDGTYYAPQFRSDQEWYENTVFPGEKGTVAEKYRTQCYTSGQTWPLGLFLTAPYKRVA